MAIEPLFVADMTTLKSKLRLSGSASTDALAMLDSVVEEVRIGFYLRLGEPRLAELTALDYMENPSDNAPGYLRALANATEVLWCRLKLLRIFPVLFMESSGNKQQAWNDEGIFRGSNQSDLSKELTRLQNDLEANLSVLEGNQSAGDVRTIQTFDGTPDETPDLPGATLFSDLRGENLS